MIMPFSLAVLGTSWLTDYPVFCQHLHDHIASTGCEIPSTIIVAGRDAGVASFAKQWADERQLRSLVYEKAASGAFALHRCQEGALKAADCIVVFESNANDGRDTRDVIRQAQATRKPLSVIRV